jgi:predicted nucleic acid-binding protein
MICLDASVAIKLVIEEDGSNQAKSLYRSMLLTRTPIVAPPLMPIEVTNIMRQQMRGPQGLSLVEATKLLEEFLALSFTIYNPLELHLQALILADAHALPATYDAHYLALAELMSCDFWTADQRLVQQVRSDLPFVRWLGEYVPSADA